MICHFHPYFAQLVTVKEGQYKNTGGAKNGRYRMVRILLVLPWFKSEE